MFCQFVKTEADCLAASSERNCKWASSAGGSGYCYHDDDEFDEMWDESYYQDFAGGKCESVDPRTRDACVAVSGCDWFEGYGCDAAKESVKKILSDTGAPPGVSSYWNEWYHDACWYLTTSTCTTSTTVTGCVLNSGDGCHPGPAKIAVYGADGCAGHADFEAVAALGGTTAAEKKPPPPPPPTPPPPPPPPKLVLDDDDATPRLGAGSAAFASACAFLTVALFA